MPIPKVIGRRSEDGIRPNIDAILNRLHKVKKTGKGRWGACCPAHADKSPSLSISETDNGSILLHCFGGCGVDEVLGALGMNASDLFPRRESSIHAVKGKPSFDAIGALRAICDDLAVVLVAARMTINGEPLAESDMKRLGGSVERIQSARSFVMGR